MAITRGLLTEQAGGVFQCVIVIPADLVGDVIAGRPITVSPLDASAALKVTFDAAKEPLEDPPGRPPAQQISGAGDLAPLILHEPEAHQEVQEFMNLLERWSMHEGLQARAAAALNPDPFQGPIVYTNQFIRKALDKMTLANARVAFANLISGLHLPS